MTSGSWSFGSSSYTSSQIHTDKTWSGGNGKTETWAGGTRLKWNDYTMTTYSFLVLGQIVSNLGYGTISRAVSQAKSIVGWNANDDLRLLAKLTEQVRGHSFDLGINIAEGVKTYEGILGNLASLGKSLVALKHGQIGDAFRYLGTERKGWRTLKSKDVSGRWLEMQYAWLPLVSQGYEAGKALAALTGPRSLRFTASIGTKYGSYEGSQGPFDYTYPVRTSYSKRLLAELYEPVSFNRSLGLVDPLSIAWEVVPYSFVVDWFLPVGTYLGVVGMIPNLVGRFLTIERSGMKAGDVKFTAQGIANGFKNLTKRERRFNLTRTVSGSLSVPLPTFNSLPRALSPKRLLNATALIHQLLK
jgi:hypothetical protein